jgi:hypothetical protein
MKEVLLKMPLLSLHWEIIPVETFVFLGKLFLKTK